MTLFECWSINLDWPNNAYAYRKLLLVMLLKRHTSYRCVVHNALKSLSQIQPESLAVSHQRWCIEDAHRCGSTVWLYRTAQNVWHSSVLLLCVWLAPMCFSRYLAVGKALWLSGCELNWEGFTKWLLGLETCTVYTLVHI